MKKENKSSQERCDMFIAEDLKVHHANWTKGIKNKLELHNFVLAKRSDK